MEGEFQRILDAWKKPNEIKIILSSLNILLQKNVSVRFSSNHKSFFINLFNYVDL